MAAYDIEAGAEGAYDSIDTTQLSIANNQGGNKGQPLGSVENNDDQRDHSRTIFETNSMSRIKEGTSSSHWPSEGDTKLKDVSHERPCSLHPNITVPRLRTLILLVLGGAVVTAFLVLVIICPVLLAALKKQQKHLHQPSDQQERSARLLKVHHDEVINRLPIDQDMTTKKQTHAEDALLQPKGLWKPSLLPLEKPDENLSYLDHLYLHVANTTLQTVDLTTDPCDDFYQYACGNWGVFNPPPPGVSRWSVFEKMTVTIWEMMEDELRVETPHLLSSADPDLLQKVRTYYNICQDEEKLEKMGPAPLVELLDDMNTIYEREMKNLQEEAVHSSERSWQLKLFQRILEHTHNVMSVPALFTFSIQPDTSHTSGMAIQLTFPTIDLIPQGSIVAGNQELIKVYRKYASQLLSAVKPTQNQSLIDQDVDDIMQMLMVFKPVAGSPLLNETNVEELNEIAPFLDWKLYFTTAFSDIARINWKEERILSQAQMYLPSISSIIIKEISNVGLRRLYTYLQWQVMQYYGHYLQKAARNAILPLFDGLSGSNTTFIPNFRLKPCIKELEEYMPMPMAYLMQQAIQQIISQNTDNKVNSLLPMLKEAKDMAESIQLEYMNYFQKFPWIDYEARKFLIDKIANVKILIGYPDILNDVRELKDLYKNLTIKSESLLQNQHRILLFNTKRKLQQLLNPELYDEWSELSPMSLITFYVYRRNSLLMPLGGIRYPLFHPDLPEAFNYAGLGVLTAHELGHSVDFVGRTRDRFGRSNSSIWPTEVMEEFVVHLTCRIDQYKAHYHSFDNILTVAEIMADDASITAAYEAAKNNLHNDTYPYVLWKNLQQLNLNAHQLFFLHYAQNFCTSYSPPDAKPIGVDHYPPHSVRVRATLANTPTFSEAFKCPKGSSMNPNWTRCEIW